MYRKDSSSSNAILHESNCEDNRRGIRNVSRVSCHVACAIQILCHAIPTIRSTLNRLIVEEEKSENSSVHDFRQSSPEYFLQELIDFVRVTKAHERRGDDGENDKELSFRTPTPWNPLRLYKCLQGMHGGTLAIDPYNVGDATRSLSCLMRLLSLESACCGPAWKRLLDASVWEGETRQILEGRRLLELCDENTPSRFVQRIKPALKCKAMLSPIVLKFRLEDLNGGLGESTSKSGWSVTKALNELVKPQRIQGSSYPWDSISPDAYLEQEIVCQLSDDCSGDSGNSSKDVDESNNSDSDIDNYNNSDSDNETDSDENSDNSDESDFNKIDWITSKRLEIWRTPRVWLMHLDRPLVSTNKIRRCLSFENGLSSTSQPKDREVHEEPFLLYDHVHVPLELDTSSFIKPRTLSTSNDDGPSHFAVVFLPGDDENIDRTDQQASSKSLFLRGAIVQAIELDDCSNENEEDFEGGHSVTLLRRNSNSDVPLPWCLIDDDNIEPISEKRAIRMIGGVAESHHCARGNNKCSDENRAFTYFAGSLLVYSVPEDVEEDGQWRTIQNEIASSWMEHKKQYAATVASEEAVVGKRIRVKWAKEKFYSGTITCYNPSTGKHQVTYDDGDIRNYNLVKKTIEWID